MVRVHIGKAIAWARRTAGMTQSQVAEHLSCNRSWIYRLEHGDNCPSFDFVEQAATLFGMANVEQLKCGLLPFRLAALHGDDTQALEKALSRVPGGHGELQLAKDGVRQPGDRVLKILADVLASGSVEQLLYGEISEPAAMELQTAKAG
jgi:transcriptional regulator with XRE-family HTH domain